MRNQQEIYIQTQNSGLRNRTIKNVNMSSDFCIFEMPSYDISNLISIQCDPSLFYLSGYSLTNILTSATTECFGTASTACYSATTWTTKIYEDSELKYSNNWYNTNTLNNAPTDTLFINSVETAFNTLNYNFSKTGTTYEIDKIFGVKELKLDLCVSFNSKSGATFSCPSGYVSNENNDGCQQITTASTTFNGSGSSIVSGNTVTDYGIYGTYFYPEIQTNGALPVYYLGDFLNLVDQTGGTITALNINTDITNTFWYNAATTTDGRLNQIGLSASTTEWVGFSKCIDIPFSGTYYVGLGADNECRFYLNGTLIVNLTGNTLDNFKKWSVFPLDLKSGKNIVEVYGRDFGVSTGFGAEIYSPIDYQTLTGATWTGSSGANVIFSTAEYVGGQWDLGTTVGYSCPSGYSLDTCSTAYTCTRILRTGYTDTCSGSCSDDCYEIATTNFNYIDNTSTGVYLIPLTGTTLIDTLINFTSNIDELENLSNLSFRYEIYKYDPNLDLFARPAVYVSDNISYGTYTGCVETYLKYAEAVGFGPESNPITISESESIQEIFSELGCSDLFIDFNNLSGDGDYLLKIFYQFDACTDYLKRLGVKIDTSIYDISDRFNIYNQEFDKYFVCVYKAEIPILINNQSINEITNTTNNLPLFQQSLIIEEETDFNSTGSTLTLLTRPDGDIFISLNGLVLSKNIDYIMINEQSVESIYFDANSNTNDLQPLIVQFYGKLEVDDIVNIVFTRQAVRSLLSESILVNSFIPTGTTNNQGTNKYYYNITTQKYEIYLDNNPLDNSNIFLTLNGIVLTNNVDYYQSISDKKRIILEGVISTNDIITVIYYPAFSTVGDITQSSNIVSWYITNIPQNNNGEFFIEYSQSVDFSTYNISDIIKYSAGDSTYTGSLNLSGTSGTEWYYRVKNNKKYVSICGDIIEDVAYSDTVKVKITSNAINSY